MQAVLMVFVLMALSAIPAWLTHVVHCIQNSEWLFMVAGAIMAPVAVIHGYGLWFGFF